MIRSVLSFFLFLIFTYATVCQDTLILKPGPDLGKDTRITQTDYATGNSSVFMCGEWTYGGVPAKDRSVIEFSLSDLPEDIQLIKAWLNLYAHPFGHSTLTGSNEAMIYRVTERWLEHEVTWQDQPEYTEENSVYLPESEFSQQDYLGIDITPMFQDMLDNPDQSHGFLLKMIREEYYRFLIFASSDLDDPEKWPELVVVYLDCEMPDAYFEYSADSMTVSFSAPDTLIETFEWDFGDGYQSSLENPVHTYEQYGEYTVCLGAGNECGVTEYCDTVVICYPAIPDFEYSVEDMTVSFTNLSTNWETLFWDFGNGFFSLLEEPVESYTQEGEYIVCLTAANSCSEQTFCDTVRVYDSQGIGEAGKLSSITVYPNPFTNRLTLKLPQPEDFDISMTDLMGREVLHLAPARQEEIVLPTENIPPGIYLILARSHDKVFVEKVVKR